MSRPSTTYWKAAFLDNLAETGLVARAARYAGVTRQTAYNARNTQNRAGTALIEAQSFAQQWDAALDQAADSAEVEVRRRAMEGTQRIHDTYRQGQKISTTVTRHYSDRLLMFLLEKLRPDTYGNPIPHACKHCGSDPRSQPSPQEVASRLIIDTYLDRLIAKSKTPPVPPAPIPPTPQPEVAPIKSDSPDQPLFVSTDVSSFQNLGNEMNLECNQSNPNASDTGEVVDCYVGAHGRAPLPAPSNNLANIESPNQPLFVSTDVSSSPNTTRASHFPFVIRNSSFAFPPSLASSPVSSLQNSSIESKIECSPSNSASSFTEASTYSSYVGAQHEYLARALPAAPPFPAHNLPKISPSSNLIPSPVHQPVKFYEAHPFPAFSIWNSSFDICNLTLVSPPTITLGPAPYSTLADGTQPYCHYNNPHDSTE